MIFNYDGIHQEFYMPLEEPGIVEVPLMHYIAIRGKGDLEAPKGDYKEAIEILFALVYTLKVYRVGDPKIDGYFHNGVQLLESFWWQDDGMEIDYTHKEDLNWMLAVRLPEFFFIEDFDWAIAKAKTIRSRNFSKIEYVQVDEGLCVQCIHVGGLYEIPETIKPMHKFAKKQGYVLDFSRERFHHEVYLSDGRRIPDPIRRTVIRHPIKKSEK
ncbi:MAG: GyrI-like domain-containing protein, partial [Pseudobutyrivibrio sp.]|nr:GyrI-like domain-containing protein [Pseudobutyrivibrio sp.]